MYLRKSLGQEEILEIRSKFLEQITCSIINVILFCFYVNKTYDLTAVSLFIIARIALKGTKTPLICTNSGGSAPLATAPPPDTFHWGISYHHLR